MDANQTGCSESLLCGKKWKQQRNSTSYKSLTCTRIELSPMRDVKHNLIDSFVISRLLLGVSLRWLGVVTVSPWQRRSMFAPDSYFGRDSSPGIPEASNLKHPLDALLQHPALVSIGFTTRLAQISLRIALGCLTLAAGVTRPGVSLPTPPPTTQAISSPVSGCRECSLEILRAASRASRG